MCYIESVRFLSASAVKNVVFLGIEWKLVKK